MKLKFNWGTGIFIVIILGVLWYISLAIFSTRQEFYLVENDYYSRGINHEKHIEKVRNAQALNEKFSIEVLKDSLILKIPDWDTGKVVQGTIWFYRPDNANDDYSLALAIDDDGRQAIDTKSRRKGKYLIKLDWQMNNIEYYYEKSVMLY
ncbi:MAG: FixH family protein [Bacteroidota bacterium]|nr:FixH family protein [Bacteroidota bacterium]